MRQTLVRVIDKNGAYSECASRPDEYRLLSASTPDDLEAHRAHGIQRERETDAA